MSMRRACEADAAALPHLRLQTVFALELREEFVGLELDAEHVDLPAHRREVARRQQVERRESRALRGPERQRVAAEEIATIITPRM